MSVVVVAVGRAAGCVAFVAMWGEVVVAADKGEGWGAGARAEEEGGVGRVEEEVLRLRKEGRREDAVGGDEASPRRLDGAAAAAAASPAGGVGKASFCF